MKKCINCSQTKPLTEFYRKLDKHQSRCKGCHNEVHYVWRNKSRPKKIEAYFEARERKATS